MIRYNWFKCLGLFWRDRVRKWFEKKMGYRAPKRKMHKSYVVRVARLCTWGMMVGLMASIQFVNQLIKW